MNTKICTKCNVEQNIENFDKHLGSRRSNCKSCAKIYRNQYNLLNKEKKNRTAREYRKNNREKVRLYFNNYEQKRRKINLNFRITENLRARLNKALKGSVKSDATIMLLGCNIDFLKHHIQSQFLTGMSWDNYGEWHIDHIIPCSYFDLSKLLEQQICFNYRNLQPIWAHDNYKKADKLPEDFEKLFLYIKSQLQFVDTKIIF